MNLFLAFMVGFIVEMLLEIPNIPFYPNDLYRGAIVIHKPEEKKLELYTNCKEGKIVYIDKNIVGVKWIECKNPEPQFSGTLYEWHSKDHLELKYK